jgi:hypothetical protein
MKHATDILLLANQPEKVVNLNFLLRLSNFEVVQINNDIEAFNFLVQRQNSLEPMNMLLIADADINQPILHLLNELERRNAMLPILLIHDTDIVPLTELDCHAHIKALIGQCNSAATHSYLRKFLTSLQETTSKVS